MNRLRFIVSATLLLVPSFGFAQATAGGANLQIPPDVRAEGMGRAWAPLATSPYAAWSNVGALGLLEGVQFAKTDAQLVPDLADDVYYDYYSIVAGYSPISDPTLINFSLGYNRTDLDYGESIATSPDSPDAIGTFSSWEKTDGLTLAVGIGDVVGIGLGYKHVYVNLAPAVFADGDGSDDTWTFDYGIMAQSPHLVFGGEGEDSDRLGFSQTPTGHLSVRALGAMAWSNRGGEIQLVDRRQSDPMPAVRRESIGLEIRALPLSRYLNPESKFLTRILRDTQIITFSAAIGRADGLVDVDIPDSIAVLLSENELNDIVTYDGFEIRLLDTFSYRRGSIFDDPGEIKGYTEGWGVSLLGYIGLDYAQIPQYKELKRVDKWSFWVRVPLDEW